MKMHVVTGLPRSGSTLLCNVLNQNPRFWATTTSILPQVVGTVSKLLSDSWEFKAALDKREKEVTEQAARSMRAFVAAWYEHIERPLIFDKSRGWAIHSLLLQNLYPDAKFLVMVRDLRAVFGSCEKQHRKTGLFDEAQQPAGKMILGRYQNMFSPQGLIGGSLAGVMDMVRRNSPNALFIRYEDFAENPGGMLSQIYSHLKEAEYEHDFLDVKNTAEDPDGLYLNKYPHKGCGKIEKRDPQEWHEFVPRDIAQDIARNAAYFDETFGYL